MTVDFRPPEERGVLDQAPDGSTRDGRALVQTVLMATAVLMLVAGVAIWFTAPAFLSPEVSPLVAIALMLAGVFDALMAWGFGRWWPARR